MNSGIESKIIISVTADTKEAISKLKELKKIVSDINSVDVSKIKSLSNKIKPQKLMETKDINKSVKEISKAYDKISKKSVLKSGLPKKLNNIPDDEVDIKEKLKDSKKVINLQRAVSESAKKATTALNPLVNKNVTDNWQKNFFTTRKEPTEAENIRAKANMIPDDEVYIREQNGANQENRKKAPTEHESLANLRARMKAAKINKDVIEKRMQLAKTSSMFVTNEETTAMQDFSKKIERMKAPIKGITKTFGRNILGFSKKIKEYRKAHNIKGLGILPSKSPHTGIPKMMGQIGRIAMYRLFRVIIKAITTAIQKGFSTMVAYDSKVKTSLSEFTSEINYLQNSLAAFAYNVFEAIKPQITQIVEFAISQFNTLSIAVAQLMGKDSYKKAINVWKDFGTTVAASFDELNILNPDTTTENPFEDVELPDDSEAILLETKLKSILAIAGLVGLKFASFGTAIKVGGLLLIVDSLKDNFSTLYKKNEEFRNSLDSLVNTVKTVFSDLFVGMNEISSLISNVFDRHEEEIVSLSIAINNTLSTIINFIKTSLKGIFNYIENSNSIKSFVTSLNNLLKEIFTLIEKIVDLVSTVFVSASKEVSYAFDSIFNVLTNIADLRSKTLNSVASIITKIKNTVSNILKPVLKIVSSVLQILSPIIELRTSLIVMYLDVLSPILGLVGEVFTIFVKIVSLVVSILSPILSGIFEILGSVLKIVLYPILKVFETIFEVVEKIATWLGSKIPNSLAFGLSVAKYVEKSVETVNKMVENWTSGVDAFFESIKRWIYKIPDWIKSAYNSVVGKVGDWFDKAVSVGEDAWNFTKGVFTGQTFASGGFVDSGTAFIAGESGAEMVGNINGRTGVMNESQITSAFAEALVNTGYLNQQSDNQSTPEFNIYLDSKKIASAVEKANYNKSTSFYKNGIKGSNF